MEASAPTGALEFRNCEHVMFTADKCFSKTRHQKVRYLLYCKAPGE